MRDAVTATQIGMVAGVRVPVTADAIEHAGLPSEMIFPASRRWVCSAPHTAHQGISGTGRRAPMTSRICNGCRWSRTHLLFTPAPRGGQLMRALDAAPTGRLGGVAVTGVAGPEPASSCSRVARILMDRT